LESKEFMPTISDQKRRPAEVPGETSNSSGVLGNSLQRLYQTDGFTGTGSLDTGAQLESSAHTGNSSSAALDLTESLLEAVFEISEFDPLPHLNSRENEFGFGFMAGSPHYPAPAKPRPATPGSTKTGTEKNGIERAMGLDHQSKLSVSPDGLSGSDGLSAMDRRKLPRRESECIVSICRCRDDERLTSERISWLLHATKLKGRLIDVSMSGVAFHAQESLAGGSKILLRIANRTIDKQVDTQAVILRSRAASDGGWDVVCRFHKNLTFEQIHTVGQSLFAATIV
jgi:hypothetical protein